jgi:hypothetical protein
MTISYVLTDPIPARAPEKVVYVVRWTWADGEAIDMYRSVSGATGRVGGIIGATPGSTEWTRDGTEYRWTSPYRGTLVIEERAVWP